MNIQTLLTPQRGVRKPAHCEPAGSRLKNYSDWCRGQKLMAFSPVDLKMSVARFAPQYLQSRILKQGKQEFWLLMTGA